MDRISNTTAPNTTELAEIEERLRRASNAVNLWGETYVPPIEPVRRQEMIDKWSGKTWSPPANRQVRLFCFHLLIGFEDRVPHPLAILCLRYSFPRDLHSCIS